MREIWADAFPEDAPADIDRALRALWRPGTCLTGLRDGRPVTMLFLLPAALEREDGPPLALRYVYAAATLTPYRGQGLFPLLAERAAALAREGGASALFLRPASASLSGYYARLGYREFFRVQTERVALPPARACFPAGEIPPGGESAARDAALAGHPAWVRWPCGTTAFAAASVRAAGGTAWAADGGFALCEPADGGLWSREWLGGSGGEAELLRRAAALAPGGTLIRRRPVFPGEDGEAFGMIRPLTAKADAALRRLTDKAPYMGLALD